MWDQVVNGELVLSNQPKPHISGYGNITAEQLARFGWYEQRKPMPDPMPEGKYVSGWNWSGVLDGRSVYAPVLADVPPEPVPVPMRVPVGVDTPMLVLDAPDGEKGVGVVADGYGGLVQIVYAHESPYDMEALRAKITVALANRAATRAARVDEARAVAAGAGAANSVPALRAEVARLAALVEAMV